ncbi:MAG: class I SAM-dependent methyltransferase [Actinobacteria bacterium]|nr:class I SAM-dependent methyltransferase [Actinomycetota bacterium]
MDASVDRSAFVERIACHGDPAVRVEHELRYRWAAPLIERARTWIDLGCGSGVGASVVDARSLERVVLVDVDEHALEGARSAIAPAVDECEALRLDLSSQTDLERLAGVLAGAGETVVTCFEVIEHLATYQHLIELLAESARGGQVTCVLSLPNDAHFGVDNPFHLTKWSAAAFDELVQFLPAPLVVARQGAIAGSYIAAAGDGGIDLPGETPVEAPAAGPEALPPTHFLAAFGPLVGQLTNIADSKPVDFGERRVWEAQREADLEYYRTRLDEREQDVATLSEVISELRAKRSWLRR